MTGPVTVTFPSGDAVTAALVASLAGSLQVVPSGEAELVILRGTSGWGDASRAALAGSARAVVVLDPVAEDAGILTRLADDIDRTGSTLLLSASAANNPAVPLFASWLGDEAASLSLDSSGPDAVADQLLIQLRILRALGIAFSPDPGASGNRDAVLASGRDGRCAVDRLVRLRATRTEASGALHRIAVDGAGGAARLHIPGGGEARPAEARRMTPHAEERLPPIYESGHRVCLRNLMTGKEAQSGSGDLRAFLHDLRIVEEVLA